MPLDTWVTVLVNTISRRDEATGIELAQAELAVEDDEPEPPRC
jgi:hypothetical protein